MVSSLFLLPVPFVAYVLYKLTSPNPARHSASASPSSSSTSLPSLLLRLTTTHKRLLPTPAQHAFEYPLLYYGLDLEDLEEKRLDRRFGNLAGRGLQAFGYARKEEKGNKAWTVTGLGEGSYLSPTLGGEGDEEGKMGGEKEEEEGGMVSSVPRSSLSFHTGHLPCQRLIARINRYEHWRRIHRAATPTAGPARPCWLCSRYAYRTSPMAAPSMRHHFDRVPSSGTHLSDHSLPCSLFSVGTLTPLRSSNAASAPQAHSSPRPSPRLPAARHRLASRPRLPRHHARLPWQGRH